MAEGNAHRLFAHMHVVDGPEIHPASNKKVMGICEMSGFIWGIEANPPSLQAFTKNGNIECCLNLEKVIYPCSVVPLPGHQLVISDWYRHSKKLFWITVDTVEGDWKIICQRQKQLDYRPGGITLDTRQRDQDMLMVCDPENHRIHWYTTSGQEVRTLELLPQITPWKVLVNPAASGYVTLDSEHHSVVWLTDDGEIINSYKSIDGQFSPYDIAWGGSILWVADSTNDLLHYLMADGSYRTSLYRGIPRPMALYISAHKNKVYVGCRGENTTPSQIMVMECDPDNPPM